MAGPVAPAALAQLLPPDVERPAAYIAVAEGRTVASHRAKARRQPASLAKLAGALVVLERARRSPTRLDAVVRVSERAARPRGTSLGLAAGDRARAGDLLAAMLVGSANDACLALAEHVAGTVKDFVGHMNALAGRLGMRDTRFVDPCGFDQPGQHTTAADLLKLAHASLAEETLAQIAQQPAASVSLIGSSRALVVRNTNHLLHAHSGAFGLKTGYTRQAGQCIIAAARRGPAVGIVVILGARDRWPVSVALLDYALDQVSAIPRVQDPAVAGRPDR